jgi:hypothetical protein
MEMFACNEQCGNTDSKHTSKLCLKICISIEHHGYWQETESFNALTFAVFGSS